MHFQLFLPNRFGANPAHLEQVGLADLAGGAFFVDVRDFAPRGGEPASGLLVAWPRPGDNQHRYAPDEQTWTPAVPHEGLDAARYWLGIWTAEPPTPKQLARPYQHRGWSARLGDGNEWLFPYARELPRDVILQDDGSWGYVLQREFAAFGRNVDRFRQALRSEGAGASAAYDDIVDFCLQALAINYRFVRELIPALRLFSTENLVPPLQRVVAGPLKEDRDD